ncbi:Hypothetical predicted protein [Cloeon dipterum]|uniref:OAR domain-containing protein n=1 Tax=Cloeon dipterum TaxID=197152 RepID=A0A8S1E7I3_9INSE|nr:Hypothetical predicted protein [Cloeon dipterum]
MNAAAAAAADFKNGFGSQFNGLMQPFADSDSLYSSYSSYNNWAKVPSPLGAKSFHWGLNTVAPLSAAAAAAQPSINCFNTPTAGVNSGAAAAALMPGSTWGVTAAFTARGVSTCSRPAAPSGAHCPPSPPRSAASNSTLSARWHAELPSGAASGAASAVSAAGNDRTAAV